MDRYEVERWIRAQMRRAPGDGVFQLGELIHSMGQQVREDVGSGPVGGKRAEGAPRGKPGPKKKGTVAPRIRLWPTNSERENRAHDELSPVGFEIQSLLSRWRGAPARGNLPFFTVLSLGKICSMARNTVRKGLKELVGKGWIRVAEYSKHHKNTLYKLVPIREVPLPADRRAVQRDFDGESAAG